MNHSLYFHIPFCLQRCAYCDFNTYAGQDEYLPSYIDALCREVEYVGKTYSSKDVEAKKAVVHTMFFGGGTPSLVSPVQYEQVLKVVDDYFDVLPDAEISLEANPGTLSLEALRGLHHLGFNRLSLGVQSAHADELHLLGRIHDYNVVIQSVKWSRQAGFANLNLDLIYGLPGQPLARWSESLNQVLELGPEHLSLYALTIEHGTPFGRWAANGRLAIPDPDLAAQMYEWAGEFLEDSGYAQYEISNWARMRAAAVIRGNGVRNPSYACRHNLQYWHGDAYLGFGAGAHGYAAGVRYSNVLRIKTYLQRFMTVEPLETFLPFPLSPAVADHRRISLRTAMQETMLTGLRLTREGVSGKNFYRRHGVELMEVFGEEISESVQLGLLEWVGKNRIRLTPRGRLLGNQVFIRFIDD